MATQAESRKDIIERYKKRFSPSAGGSYYPSSSTDYAEYDLKQAADSAAENAPLFIETLFDTCEELRREYPDWFIPDHTFINRVLTECGVGYEIRPPALVLR